MKNFLSKTKYFLLILIVSFFLPKSVSAQTTVIHSFPADGLLGSAPSGTLLLSDGIFYGLANGGEHGEGVIFSVNPDGSNYTVLHEFTAAEGSSPEKSLVISGNTLYGFANRGGANNYGTIFSIDTDGSNFDVLHEFAGGANDGSYPGYVPLLIENTLYGMALNGGDDESGVIFSITTDGSDFTLLHEFSDLEDDGGTPLSGLIHSAGILYGMTGGGGDTGNGVIFSIGVDGSNFTLLHEFSYNDGGNPQAELTLVGDTLFGMTNEGADDEVGVIFSIQTDGSDFAVLHEFTNSETDGGNPRGSLFYRNNKLFGLTNSGGSDGSGTIFSIDLDGSNFQILHSFDSADVTDGYSPYGSLTYYSGRIYATTDSGGSNDTGALLYYVIEAPTEEGSSPSTAPFSTSYSTSQPHTCGDTAPAGQIELFQINRTGTAAILYFTPIRDNISSYHIVYGYKPEDQRFGLLWAPTAEDSNSGVQSITINHLDPKSNYSFSVIPVNGCAAGTWSNWLSSSWLQTISYKFM